MSTKMHNYRIPKDRWWDFATACRRYYLDNHPITMAALRVIADEASAKDTALGRYKAVQQFADTIATDWTVDLQVFDEGDTYIIRPLEYGHFFMNHHDNFAEFGLEPVFYDNRADVPPEEEKNKAVADWVDGKIEAREYLIYTVLDCEDFTAIGMMLIGAR